MDAQKQQIIDRLKQANNILVTVKSNPTVDHLAACIGLTLALNKLGKHATAVFSGAIPSTIEFLQPEKTLEKTTDSLRDFIIALDKSKADKLRYKVEDKVVKIFITPYRTSISEQDLNFSQGDFNVDVVLALGVHAQTDLDLAITTHGRILHDATIASVNIAEGPTLGALNWTKPNSSSLSELVAELLEGVDKKLLDSQIATALLTGIVAETDRFSNNKTSPQTMSISAELMAAGANQQLVATKLAEPAPAPTAPPAAEPAASQKKNEDGTLEIEHEQTKPETAQIDIDENGSLHTVGEEEPAEQAQTASEKPADQDKSAANADLGILPEPTEPPDLVPAHTEGPHMILEPPTLGGQLTAGAGSGGSEFFDPMMDSASGAPPTSPTILNRSPLGDDQQLKDDMQGPEPTAPTADTTVAPALPINDDATGAPTVDNSTAPPSTPPLSPEPPAPQPSDTHAEDTDLGKETLTDIEKQLNSPHLGGVTTPTAGATPSVPTASAVDETSTPAPPPPPSEAQTAAADLSNARDAVEQAIHSSTDSDLLEPIKALNAQPLDLNLHTDGATPSAAPAGSTVSPNPAPFAPPGLTLPTAQASTIPTPPSSTEDTQAEKLDPNAPPPVPPPMLPPPLSGQQ